MRRHSLSRGEAMLLILLFAVSLAVRVCTLGGPLDEPSWRQADTAYMIARMALESPPELLHPKAPFRGADDVKAAEFPLYPLVVSFGYKLAGHESLPLARIVTLLFFAGACFYLFKLLDAWLGRRVAWYGALTYTAVPLAIFYSRAVHPDFSIVFFSHAFAWHAFRYFETRRAAHYAVAVLAASMAFLMKAPYCFYWALPVAVCIVWDRPRAAWRDLVALGAMFIVPLALALWFNQHRVALEAGATESLVYPMKWTHDSLSGRFFGTLSQRFDPAEWVRVARFVVYEVLTPLGVALALGALLLPWRSGRGRGWTALLAVAVGTGVYTLLLFPMLGGHPWYLLPLAVPFAALAGASLDWMGHRFSWGPVAAAVLVLAMGCLSARALSVRSYFVHDWQRIEAGRAIRALTPADALIVSTALGRSTGWSDPRILYFADRRGWAREFEPFTADDLRSYQEAGADYVALLVTPIYSLTDETFRFLSVYPREISELRDPHGAAIGHLVLFNIHRLLTTNH